MALPYDYYPAVMYAITVLGQGNTLTAACDAANVEVTTFRHYVNRDPKLQELYDDAQQRSYDAMADALINIDNHKVHGQTNPQMAKVISENIKWVLSKRRPKEFGERIEVTHEITMDRAITEALNAARNRTRLPPVNDIIDATVVYEDEDDAILRQLLS